MKAHKLTSLLNVFVSIFGFDPTQPTTDFERNIPKISTVV